MLTLIKSRISISKSRNSIGLYKCICGNEKLILESSVKSGHTKSCGCLQLKSAYVSGCKRKKHGLSFSNTYRSYRAMKTRCYSSNFIHYHSYGGRGITVCPQWVDSFKQFYADMGDRPVNKTLDRIDVDGNYEPSNCKWSTASEQANNRRKSVKT